MEYRPPTVSAMYTNSQQVRDALVAWCPVDQVRTLIALKVHELMTSQKHDQMQEVTKSPQKAPDNCMKTAGSQQHSNLPQTAVLRINLDRAVPKPEERVLLRIADLVQPFAETCDADSQSHGGSCCAEVASEVSKKGDQQLEVECLLRRVLEENPTEKLAEKVFKQLLGTGCSEKGRESISSRSTSASRGSSKASKARGATPSGASAASAPLPVGPVYFQ
eukprot:TRINITY_DN14319_c0_g1_i1.p1 TRINITY_DN14319_c0_g1~~TRINITY_DN14319_c0_g1_i1.p1  ORF type:complete len:220 (+),score=27.95 TRINITY_DN14319_c0_g1_i1:35-694(+)